MWNRHRESEKHKIGSGTKLLFTFLSLRFSDMRRERHNFFLGWLFHLTPPHAAPHHKLLVWLRWALENQLPSSSVKSQLTVFFKFQNPQLTGMMTFMSPGPISYQGFFIVTSVIVTSTPHAHEHLHSMCAPN